MWATIQDPYNAAYRAYGTGVDAPGVFGPGDKVYKAAHNMILAHACAYKRYKSTGQKGIRQECYITNNLKWIGSELNRNCYAI